MASTESGRGEKIEDLLGGKHNDRPGEKYRVGGTDIEESATEITEWSREKTEESASEGEAETAWRTWEVGTNSTTTAEGPEGSGAETVPGGTSAGRGATLDVTTVVADAARARG